MPSWAASASQWVALSRLRSSLYGWLLCAACSAVSCGDVAAAQSAPSPGPQAGSAVQGGSAALRAGHPQQALALLQGALAEDPQSAPANLLAASAEIALYRPADAVRYAERAEQLEPGNWKVHTTLVTAYTMAGDVPHRDAERALLHKAHEDPALPDARESSGFLLDLFHSGAYTVEAVEYFKPIGKYNTYFRFLVRDPAGARVWTIEVNSDSLNQSSWAQAYPRQAAEGQRQFQIEGAQGEVHVGYSTFSGAPSYDYSKGQVLKILAAHKEPFPGEARALPGGP